MAKMQKPELKVVRFSAEDVIATSGGVELRNFGDTNVGNNTWNIGDKSFTKEGNDLDGLQNALREAGNGGTSGDMGIGFFYDSLYGFRLDTLWNASFDNNVTYGILNGTYTWNEGCNYWLKTGN